MLQKDQKFELPDGRVIGFAVYGDADGYPIAVGHGTPGSGLKLQITEPSAVGLGFG